MRYRPTGYEDHLLKTPPKGYDASLYSWAPRNSPERGGARGMAKAAFDGYCHGDIATGRRVLACVQSHPLLVNPA